MSDPIEDIRDWLVASGIFTGYDIQADEWKDKGKNTKELVIYSNAGTNEGSLQSNPAFRLLILGDERSNTRGDGSPIDDAFKLIEYARNNPVYGCLSLIQPIAMPSGVGYTDQRKPFTELNLTTIIG